MVVKIYSPENWHGMQQSKAYTASISGQLYYFCCVLAYIHCMSKPERLIQSIQRNIAALHVTRAHLLALIKTLLRLAFVA